MFESTPPPPITVLQAIAATVELQESVGVSGFLSQICPVGTGSLDTEHQQNKSQKTKFITHYETEDIIGKKKAKLMKHITPKRPVLR